MEMAPMTILEASASCRQDATFQVPVTKLRSLREQVRSALELPDTGFTHPTWSILSEDLCQILSGLEMHCALRGNPDNKEVHILRLKFLLNMICQWPDMWVSLDDDEYLRVRCFQSSWTAESWTRWLDRQAEDMELSQEEKYEIAAKRLQALTCIRDLPEASWLASAIEELRLVQNSEEQN